MLSCVQPLAEQDINAEVIVLSFTTRAVTAVHLCPDWKHTKASVWLVESLKCIHSLLSIAVGLPACLINKHDHFNAYLNVEHFERLKAH